MKLTTPVGVQIGILTQYLPNTNPQHYRYANPLCDSHMGVQDVVQCVYPEYVQVRNQKLTPVKTVRHIGFHKVRDTS
jgi:hypothetical protein